jgi:ABC-type cobalamin/Fe3+-siderophores transport system ATPase subunit
VVGLPGVEHGTKICKEDGISAVVSLHQVDLAKRYADRIIGLAHGRVVIDAAPDQLTDAQAAELYAHRPPIIEREKHASRTPLFPPSFAQIVRRVTPELATAERCSETTSLYCF